MQITDNAVVNIHYTLTNDAGDVLDSSAGREPLAYLHGQHQIIPGLENALVGKSAGDELNVTIAPEDAYGLRVEEAVQKVPREAFAQIPDLAVGMQLHGESPQGPCPSWSKKSPTTALWSTPITRWQAKPCTSQ